MTSDVLHGVDVAFDARTHIGLRRSNNEDAFLAEAPVFIVADGMGGYEAGERASAAVVSAFRDRLVTGHPVELSAVRDALSEAERRVAEVSQETTRGTGSTVTGVVLVLHERVPHWLIFNVGDSRVYRQLSAEIEQLTVDHSLAHELAAAGAIPAPDRRTFENRNVITRAIGASDARADSWIMPVTAGERLLICSDGLHGEITDEEIRAILAMTGKPESATAALIEAANRAGGRDNVTAVVVDVRSGGVSAEGEHGSTASVQIADDLEDTVDTLAVDQSRVTIGPV